jgi:exopolysaccharide production protein ExoF
MPNGHEGLAYAGDSAQPANVQDHGSLVLAGRLVRVAGVNAASCERTPAAAVDATALHGAIMGHLAHLARVAAEYRGLEEIVVPQELQGQQNDPQFAAALHEEGAAFAERKEAMAMQIASLNQARELEEREIEFTQAKEAALGRQGALLQKELDNINGLMNKGFATTSQKIGLEQSVLQTETNRLDLKLLILKAQQELSKIERNIADLRNQWRNEARADFIKTQQTLAALSQQAQATSSAPGAAPASDPQAAADCADAKEAFYVIVRGPGGVLQAFPVTPKDKVQGEASAVMAKNTR